MNTPTTNGERKYRALLWTDFVLVIGFAFAVTTHADASLFTGFVGAVMAALGTFVYGNVQVHRAHQDVVATVTTSTSNTTPTKP